jgi:hypothetical protein
VRRIASTGLVMPIKLSARLHDHFQNVFGTVNPAARVRHGKSLCIACRGALDLSHHLAQIEFWNNEGAYFPRELANFLFRKRPSRDQAKFANSQSLLASAFDSSLGYAGGDSVGDHDDIRALDLLLFEKTNIVCRIANLGLQTPD